MTMRHRPIQPKQRVTPKYTKRDAKAQHVYLTPDQQAALLQFQQDFRKAWPAIQETSAVAQRLFQELIDAPRWRVAETELPQGVSVEQPKPWSVGHAKVNIIDEREGDVS
jgi:hypothetical protein